MNNTALSLFCWSCQGSFGTAGYRSLSMLDSSGNPEKYADACTNVVCAFDPCRDQRNRQLHTHPGLSASEVDLSRLRRTTPFWISRVPAASRHNPQQQTHKLKTNGCVVLAQPVTDQPSHGRNTAVLVRSAAPLSLAAGASIHLAHEAFSRVSFTLKDH